MSRRPRIGLTLELLDPIIAKVDQRMREVIEGAGGLVVVIPHSADPESWQDAYEIVDAVVMMGGPDVSAEAYGATPHPLTKPGHAGVDTTELGLARACLRDGKPVLGICRGNQVLNVAAGGTLVQDVPSTGPTSAHGAMGARRGRPAELHTRSRCSRAPGSPSGSVPARTSSTPTTTRPSSGWARACAPRPWRPTARSRPSNR